MAEWIFIDESKILDRLGIVYRAVVEVCRGEDIEVFIDMLWSTYLHARIHQIRPDLSEPEVCWISQEAIRQWAEQQRLSVKETRRRLKLLKRYFESAEVEVGDVYCLVSSLYPFMYIAELRAVDSPQPMTIITGKRLRTGEKIPIGLFKLTPLAKELHIMEWRTKILSRLGALSRWKEPQPMTGQFVDRRTRKKLSKLIFQDNKDLIVPCSISHLVKIAEIRNVKNLLKVHPYLKADPLFNSFKGFLDELGTLEAAVNAAEVEEVKKL